MEMEALPSPEVGQVRFAAVGVAVLMSLNVWSQPRMEKGLARMLCRVVVLRLGWAGLAPAMRNCCVRMVSAAWASSFMRPVASATRAARDAEM